MASSEYTKNCIRKMWLFRIIDWLFLFGPILVYVGITLADSGVLVVEKVGVVITLLLAIILVIVNIIMKKNLKSPIWVALIGLIVAAHDYILPLIILIAISTACDEFLLSPIVNYYKTKAISSKVFDERIKEKHE